MALTLFSLTAGASPSAGATAEPLLEAAVVDVTFTSPGACEVALAVTVSGVSEVEHRIEIRSGGRVELTSLRDAVAGPLIDVGRTRALVVSPAAREYSLHYRVDLPPDRPYRCPIWLPAVATDGQSRNVRLTATLPEGMLPAGTMPAFRWTGSRGEAVVGHLPAFVLVPFAAAGAPQPWDVARVMDAVAMMTMVAGSLLWLRRARSTGRRADGPRGRRSDRAGGPGL